MESKNGSAINVAYRILRFATLLFREVFWVLTAPKLTANYFSIHLHHSESPDKRICNPSIILDPGNGYLVAVREPNYVFGTRGQLIVPGGVENLNSQTILYSFDNDLNEKHHEVIDDSLVKIKTGFGRNGLEDPRLFWNRGALYCLWSANDLNITSARRNDLTDKADSSKRQFVNWNYATSRMLCARIVDGCATMPMCFDSPYNRAREKNWMPIEIDDGLNFVYSPSELEIFRVKPHIGQTEVESIFKWDSANGTLKGWSGSSQLIKWSHGWLGVLHFNGRRLSFLTAGLGPYYFHKFIYLEENFVLKGMSRPFFFEHRGIEFCAGICLNENSDDVVISYGIDDCKAAIMRVPSSAISAMLNL